MTACAHCGGKAPSRTIFVDFNNRVRYGVAGEFYKVGLRHLEGAGVGEVFLATDHEEFVDVPVVVTAIFYGDHAVVRVIEPHLGPRNRL